MEGFLVFSHPNKRKGAVVYPLTHVVGGILLIGHLIFALEALYATCCVDDSLLAGEERMAFTAELNLQNFSG